MIPAIEDIFHMLSEGYLSFDDAEKYVREHIRIASKTDDQEALRDHFAGTAMQGILAAVGGEDYRDPLVANNAYQMADAMLEARKL